MRGRRRWAVAALIGLCACQPDPEPERDAPLSVTPDYVSKRWDGILLEFGMPDALPLLGEGWSYGEAAADGNTFRWALGEEASFRFDSNRDGRRVGFIEMEPFRFEGSPTQYVGINVNGEELAPVELRPGRERYPVDLALVSGENHVRLRFRYAGDPSRTRADRRRLAAAFYRFDVAPDEELPVAGRPGPFARVDGGMYLPPNGSVSFFHEGRPRLVVVVGSQATPSLRAARGTSLTLRARSASSAWEQRIVAEDPVTRWDGEIPFQDEPVEITLEAGERAIWVRPEWVASTRTSPGREEAPTGARARAELEDTNVVVIVLDGANALRTGLYGYVRDTTPVLDRLGRESVVFDVAVSQAVYTIASIGSFLTGQYPERHQTVTFADRLRDDVTTFPGLLTDAGFRTAAFAGNAVVSDAFGLDRGYETFVSVPRLADYTGHGDSVVKAFREWIADRGDERFFAYVHFREPHFPYNPPAPFDTRFGPATSFPGGMADAETVERLNREPPSPDVRARVLALYEGNLAYVDGLVGEILECLDENTVVVVTADHGEAIFEHGFLGHNTQLYDESIRIPLILKIPGAPPRRVPDVVELLDLAPTLLEVLGLDADPAAETMQGESLLSLALGRGGRAARPAFSRTLWDKPRYSVRTARHKLIWDSRSGSTELYDLKADPPETRDLAGEGSFVENRLRHLLFSWYREQERLKAGEPPPDDSRMSPDERREIDSLGYANAVKNR